MDFLLAKRAKARTWGGSGAHLWPHHHRTNQHKHIRVWPALKGKLITRPVLSTVSIKWIKAHSRIPFLISVVRPAADRTTETFLLPGARVRGGGGGGRCFSPLLFRWKMKETFVVLIIGTWCSASKMVKGDIQHCIPNWRLVLVGNLKKNRFIGSLFIQFH